MLTPLLTHEVGSLAKPAWRVKAAAGRPLDDADIGQAGAWGQRLGVDGHQRLLELLRKPALTAPERDEVRDWSSRYGLRFFESAGLDVVYDGEQQRSEMYAWAVAHAGGFETRGSVRSFDDKYYSKAAVTGPVSLKAPYHDREYRLLRAAARRPVKVPVTGPYTLAVWSFDERYPGAADLSGPLPERRFRHRAARRELVLDVARNLVRPNIEALLQLGATWIQIDEPGGSTEPDEIALMAEAYNACVAGLDATFSTHLCFSDYRLFFPGIEQMTGCAQYAVGFANDDSRELGTGDDARPGYRIIRRFRDLPATPALGLGVLDVHSDFVEPPELIRDRILYAAGVFGAPQRLQVVPDCGLRTRCWDIAYRKLTSMVAGVQASPRRARPVTGRGIPVIAIQNFDSAEVRTFPHGQFELCQVGRHSIGRAHYQPGWRWSRDVGPRAGTDLCQASHVGVVLAGKAAVRMADGHEFALRAGDVFIIPGGHDSWVIGDEPYESIHLANAGD